jgi:hypothetical protein
MTRAPDPQPRAMDAGLAPSTMLAMIIPFVTELPPALEPTTADTFIAGDVPLVPTPAVRSRRIVDRAAHRPLCRPGRARARRISLRHTTRRGAWMKRSSGGCSTPAAR